jgi:hypothetical protein
MVRVRCAFFVPALVDAGITREGIQTRTYSGGCSRIDGVSLTLSVCSLARVGSAAKSSVGSVAKVSSAAKVCSAEWQRASAGLLVGGPFQECVCACAVTHSDGVRVYCRRAQACTKGA